ncbi:MAG: virulence protein E [Prevotella sp.]|nr:virulence protein E [Prevotella sp.]
MTDLFEMSVFNAPITNKVPLRTVTLLWVAEVIKSSCLEPQTQALRKITDEAKARAFKGSHFPYITPAGIFSYCNDQSLLKHSGVLCMDLDHVGDVDGLKRKLIDDRLFQTLMIFRSPSGDGLKWFVRIDLQKCSHRQWFDAVRNYLMVTYGLSEKQVDPSVRNESRACFLCYDPEVYVNPLLTV